MGHKNGTGLPRFGVGREALRKIHLDPKVPRKLRVRFLQFVVVLAGADQDDLHFNIHGLWHQRHGGYR